jgi:hypothetical protein
MTYLNEELYVYKGIFEPYLFSDYQELRGEIKKIQDKFKGVEILNTFDRGYMKKGRISAELTFNILVNSDIKNPNEITRKVKSELENILKCKVEEVGEK